MRKFLGIALGLFLLVGAAGTAGAATLSYVGSLQFGLATLPSGGATSSGTIVVNASGGGGLLTQIAFQAGNFGPISTSLPVTSSATVNSVRLTAVQNLSAVITGISGAAPLGAANQMGLSGIAKICLGLGPCGGANVPVPLSPTVAGGIGIGGTQVFTTPVHTAGTYTTAPAVQLTMIHAPWTIGVPTMTIHSPGSTITTPTLPGGSAGPLSNTAAGSGNLQLVTVSKVFTSLTGAFPELPVFAILTLHFVPEPGTLLLLGSGVVGLAILGRKRARK